MDELKQMYLEVLPKTELKEGEEIYSISDFHNGEYIFWIAPNTEGPVDPAAVCEYMYNSETNEIEEISALSAINLVSDAKLSKKLTITYIRDLMANEI